MLKKKFNVVDDNSFIEIINQLINGELINEDKSKQLSIILSTLPSMTNYGVTSLNVSLSVGSYIDDFINFRRVVDRYEEGDIWYTYYEFEDAEIISVINGRLDDEVEFIYAIISNKGVETRYMKDIEEALDIMAEKLFETDGC
jgi:hypothetical protein